MFTSVLVCDYVYVGFIRLIFSASLCQFVVLRFVCESVSVKSFLPNTDLLQHPISCIFVGFAQVFSLISCCPNLFIFWHIFRHIFYLFWCLWFLEFWHNLQFCCSSLFAMDIDTYVFDYVLWFYCPIQIGTFVIARNYGDDWNRFLRRWKFYFLSQFIRMSIWKHLSCSFTTSVLQCIPQRVYDRFVQLRFNCLHNFKSQFVNVEINTPIGINYLFNCVKKISEFS